MAGQTTVNLCTPPTLMWQLLLEHPNNQEQLTIQLWCCEGLNAGILSRLIPKSIYAMDFFWWGRDCVWKKKEKGYHGNYKLQLAARYLGHVPATQKWNHQYNQGINDFRKLSIVYRFPWWQNLNCSIIQTCQGCLLHCSIIESLLCAANPIFPHMGEGCGFF